MGHEVGRPPRRPARADRAPATALYRAPADLDVARFVGEAVVLPGDGAARRRRVRARHAPRSRRLRTRAPCRVMIRPEQIRRGAGRDGSRPTWVGASVVGQSFFGADTVLQPRAGRRLANARARDRPRRGCPGDRRGGAASSVDGAGVGLPPRGAVGVRSVPSIAVIVGESCSLARRLRRIERRQGRRSSSTTASTSSSRGRSISAFEKQTGHLVHMRTNDGVVLADQILQEGRSSPADVYLTENSPELMNLEEHGLLARLPNVGSRAGSGAATARRAASGSEWRCGSSSLVCDPSQLAALEAAGVDPRPRHSRRGRARWPSRRSTPTSRRSSAP